MPCGDEEGQEIGSLAKEDPGRLHPDPLDGPSWVPRASADVLGVFLKSSVVHLSVVQSTLPRREGRTLLHEAGYRQDLHNGASPARASFSSWERPQKGVVVQ